MITKEHEIKKYCCFYASDFHLEMILLPYIKENIDNTKFMIFTEENLTDSMNILLNRTNLNIDEKKQMMKLNWNNKEISISNCDLDNYTIIINGDNKYISNVNEKIKQLNPTKLNIIDCYNINDKTLEVKGIEEKYDQVLNTQNYKNK